MDIRKVTDTFSVSPQIRPEDVRTLAKLGFSTIICNRPDDEEFGQPLYETVAAEAARHGLAVHHLPVTSGMFGPQHVTATEELLAGAQGKVFAYCRSGTRSVMLWAFQEVARRPREEVIALAAAAGYDLSQQI